MSWRNARRILVEPVDQLGPLPLLILERVEQPVEMLVSLGPALRRQPRRLVEHQRIARPVDHHLADERLFLGRQRLHHPRRACAFGRGGFGGRNGQCLPGLDPDPRRRLLPIDPQPPRPRPARHEVEADLGQVPLEPAVEANAVVVLGDGKDAFCGHSARLAEAREIGEAQCQNANAAACSRFTSLAASGPSHAPS